MKKVKKNNEKILNTSLYSSDKELSDIENLSSIEEYITKFNQHEENINITYQYTRDYCLQFEKQHPNVDITEFIELLSICEDFHSIITDASNFI